MPEEIVLALEKIIDDFVFDKNGARVNNAVAIATLKAPLNEGGFKLIDLRSRNEAIALMILQRYHAPADRRPVWPPEEPTHTTVAGIPPIKVPPSHSEAVAAKYNAQCAPMTITPELRDSMPFWYHIGRRPDTRALYGDKWGVCQQKIHHFSTTKQMVDHARKNDAPDHLMTPTCDCYSCYDDRLTGCDNPIECRKNASTKLDSLAAVWDPRSDANQVPHRTAPNPEAIDGFKETWNRTMTENGDPTHHIRVLVDWKKEEQRTLPTADIAPALLPAWDTPRTTVYTDGSCSGNGTASARAGSGIWYGENEARNEAIRIPTAMASNNVGELVAALVAIQKNPRVQYLDIVSDSKYTIDALTTLLPRWADEGFTNCKNKSVLAAMYGEVLASSSTIRTRKVKGHSGDPGNDAADALAATGAEKEVPDHLNLRKGVFIKGAGVRLATATQSLLYRAIRRRADKHIRARTEANIDTIQSVIEEINGEKPLESAIWDSLGKGTVLTKKAKVFLWKTVHEGHKIGTYWEKIDSNPLTARMPCSLCQAPVESMAHILFECRASGQETAWQVFNELWDRTGKTKPYITLGTVMGVGLVQIKDERGKIITGATRLFRILLSETVYAIRLNRCDWRIGKGSDPTKILPPPEVRNRLLRAVNVRLRNDRVLTNHRSYGKKALNRKLVERTWYTVLDEAPSSALPPDWATNMGVLVGVGRVRRPPGRNR
ncbi:hypothetical protein D9611_013726 [Ephemerocybe angulata]|uniref:ribonuclease H n=1 Tax=Ephemerocybe angulata TaxID=980116 RepID=A0A8H5BCQ1_9AGAR|nr:hypothetical protein D9611_013726 [Tulosesus angulatus]